MLIAASVVVIGDEPSLTEAGKPLLIPGGYWLACARPGEPTLSQSVTHLNVPVCLRFNPATVQVPTMASLHRLTMPSYRIERAVQRRASLRGDPCPLPAGACFLHGRGARRVGRPYQR
jgi:hypothetical protein